MVTTPRFVDDDTIAARTIFEALRNCIEAIDALKVETPFRRALVEHAGDRARAAGLALADYIEDRLEGPMQGP